MKVRVMKFKMFENYTLKVGKQEVLKIGHKSFERGIEKFSRWNA